MLKDTLGGLPDIKSYVNHKLSLFAASDKTMRALFSLMFSESDNVMSEYADGYRIFKTTYGESYASVKKRTAKLSALLDGAERGSIVGLSLDNSLDWIELFWSILHAGYRPLLMNTRLDTATLNKVFADYDVKAVISAEKGYSVKTLTPSDIDGAETDKTADESVFADEVFLMSSNTSSRLKICGYTGEQFYYQIKDSSEIIKHSKSAQKHYKGNLKLLAFLPLYHIFGLVAVYIWFCFFSRTLVFLKNYAPQTILGTVRKHEVTHIFAVPVLWEKIYASAIAKIKERGDKTYRKFLRGMKLVSVPVIGRLIKRFAFRQIRENIFGESVCFMINGGGYISENAMRFMNGIGYFLTNGYGMTETGITSVELSERAEQRNMRSVGKPFGALEYRINEDGELLVRGKSLSHKIMCEGVTTVRNDDEWFNTHDLFTVKNGKYYINGRKDDLIVCANGENLNPDITEPKLAVDGITGLCLTGEGEAILIAQIGKYTDENSFGRIQQRLNAKIDSLGLAPLINRIIYTDTPLRGENEFKTARKKILQRLREGKLNIIDHDNIREKCDEETAELMEKVRATFAESLGKEPADIGYDSHYFFDLGGSSLDYFTMVTEIQSEFGISFPSSAHSSASTVREVSEYIKQYSNKG